MNPGARTEHLTFPARASRALLSVWATLTFVLCVLALTLTGGASAAVTASGPVTISSVTGSIFATDSNKCALNEGPRAMYIGYAFTATSAVSNVNATLNVTGTGFSLAGGQTPTQYIGNLAAGAKRTLFWYVTFPCTNGATADLNVTVANDITGTVVATGGSTYTVDTMISASAGGDPRLIVDVAGAVVGQLISREVTFKVGNIGSNNEAMFEPAGNLDFDASCLQLVSTRITSVTNVAGVTQGVTDSLYFTGVGSGGGQNNQVVVQYDFLYTGICNIPAGQTQVKATPYSYSGSGTQIKYLMSDGVTGGTYFKFDQATNAFTITKTASYSGTTGVSASSGTNVSAPGGGIITYTVTIKNTSPTYPAILTKITDTLPTSPASVIYGNVTGTSAVNASNSMVMPTANTSSSTQPLLVFRPLTSTSYQVAPGGSLVLQYTVTVPSNVGVYTNTASASVYSFNIGTASATVNTAPRADLGVTKALTSPAGPVYVGDTLTYTLTVNNAGPNAATNVAVTDVLPAGMTQANVTGVKLNTTTTITPTYTTNASGQTVMTMPTVQTLATGSANNLVYTITATAPSAGGSITNTASVAGSTGDANPTNDTSSVTTTVNPKADLGIVKTLTSPTSGTIYSGDQLTYTLTASNAGPSAAQTVAVTDTLPVGATQANVVSVKLGVTTITPTYSTNAGGQTVMTMPGVSSLATGSANNLVYTVVITAPTVSVAGSVTNSASVTSATYDPTTPNTSNVVSTVNPRADLSVTKVLTSPTGPVYVGDALTYTVTVTNNGPSAAQSVSVTDALPASMTQASVTSVTLGGAAITPTYTTSGAQTTMTMPNAGTLNSGASLVYTVTVTAPGTPASIVNSASASTTTPDTNTANNSSSVSTTVAAKADLSIVKTLTSPSGTVYAGDALTYTVTVTNNGPSAAQSVSVLDTLPVGVTQSSVTGVTLAGVAVTPTYGTSGSQTTMTMPTVTTLNSGASLTYTVTVTAPSVNASTSVTNTASVSSATADLVSGNNTSSVGTTITPKADLSVVKTLTNPSGTVYAGNALTYTVTVTNNGPSAAQSVSVTDTLPVGIAQGSVTLGGVAVTPVYGTSGSQTTMTMPTVTTLNSGASLVYTITVTAPAAGGSITNTASATTTTFDPTTPNTSSVGTTITPRADLSVTKVLTSPTSATIYAGDQLTYTVTVSNNGPSAAQSVSVLDTLPVGVTQASVTLSGAPVTPVYGTSGSQTTLTMPTVTTLNSGASLTYTVVITAPSAGGSITNTASASSATADLVTTNNSSSVSTTVAAKADLSVTKVLTSPTSGTIYAGDQLTYTLTASNAGPSTAQTVLVTDTLPAGATQVNVVSVKLGTTTITPTYSTNAGGQTVMTMPGVSSLATGSANNLVYTVVITAPVAGGSITNTASVSSATADLVSANNSSSVSTTVAAKADLSIVKTLTSPSGTVYAGDALTYTVTVTNNGPSAAQSVSVLDTLPVGVTQSSVTGVTLAGAAVTPTYGTSGSQTTMTMPTVTTLNSGASLTYTVTVTAPSVNASTSVTNTASVSSATADLVSGNNTSSVGTTITPKADLAVTSKSHTPGVFNVNTVVTYTIDVVNNGPSAVTGASVTDVLPAGLTFANAAGDVTCVVTGTGTCGASTYTSATRTLALPLNLTSGATARITVRVTVSGAAGTVIRNTATISVPAGVADLDTTNNSASDAPVTVGSTAAVVSLVKTVRNVTQNFPANGAFSDTSNASGNPLVPIRSGDVMEYCITYSNTGGPASGFLLADPLASLLTFLPDAYGTGLGILWQRSDASGTLLALGTSGTIPADGQALTNVKLNASNNQDDAGYYDATTVSVRLGTITVPGAGNAGSRGRMCFQTTVR